MVSVRKLHYFSEEEEYIPPVLYTGEQLAILVDPNWNFWKEIKFKVKWAVIKLKNRIYGIRPETTNGSYCYYAS